MDHGAGLLVPGVKDELEKVRGELRAREAFHLLKKELESVTLTIPDGELDSAAVVDLEPLKAAILGVRPNQGKHSKKLLSLAELVISVLESLLSGKSSAIDQEKIDDVAAQYNAFHLNALSIEKVFKYIKVHNFLKILTETMRKFHTAERLVEGVNDVRSSIKSLPPKFIPWLKAAYVYCELLGAFESQDWIRIVESTRSLEDCIAVLSTVKITSEGEGKHEAAFVAILREKKVAGYKTALAIKADQEKQRSEEEVSGLSPEESLKLQLRRQDELNPYGIGELRAAGYDDKAVLNIKPPIKFLWAYDFDLVLLRKAGYQAGSLLVNNFRVAELYFAGFSVDRLKAAGCSVPDLRAAGVTFDQLRLAGFKEAEILSGGLPVDFLKVVEYDASKLVKMGLATKDLVAAGFSALELRAAGFSALELKNSGMKDPRRLYEAGYDMVKLKAAFDIGELKSAGFTFEMLRRSDFTDKCLFDAGFEFELERDALMALFEATRGMQWKVRLHWGTSRPVSEWYGVQTELDERDRDRVVGLQLCDNNLCGSLPEKLWMLSRLKSVQLSMNRLQGSVPALVVKRLQTNNVQADLSNNPSLLPISPFKLSQQQGPSSPAPRNPLQRDTSMTSLSAPSTPAAASVNMNLFGSTGRYSGAVPPTPAGTSLAENNSTPAIPNEHEDIERAALMDLFHAASGSRWIRRTHWGTNRPIGEWFGVTQNKAGRVSRLCLASNNLHGSVPDSISYLEALRELDLRLNQLMGPVPSSLGNIKHLQKIHLQTNKLSCAIPDSLGQLAHLTVLDLRSNQLTDAVPQSLNRLTKLQYLGLRSNKLLAASTKEAIANIPWCKVVV
jgi:Leucine-rich repeat (LRR) protein/ribosomal protein L13E